jgi:hypothetical protein
VQSSLSNISNYDVATPDSYLSKALAMGVEKGHNSTRKELKTHGTTRRDVVVAISFGSETTVLHGRSFFTLFSRVRLGGGVRTEYY